MTDDLLAVVGARPNFVKVGPVLRELALPIRLLHTGQHYDPALSYAILDQLGMSAPDHLLGVGSGTHAEQTAAVMVGVERVLAHDRPSAVLVAGDVNSTMGAALAAVKDRVPTIHLEAGLRSRDWSMPEEVNRVVTDRVSDLLLCHSEDAVENLAAEGISGDRVALVGNTMIDSLFELLPSARATRPVERHGLAPGGYVLVTLHRPPVVDNPDELASILDVLAGVARRLPVVLPLHPRTRARLTERHLAAAGSVRLLDPLGYLEFVGLEERARLVVTDSGGVQEETSALGVPCLTYRTTTERPITVRMGTNRVVGIDPPALLAACNEALDEPAALRGPSIPLWDGKAGARAAGAIGRFLTKSEVTARVP